MTPLPSRRLESFTGHGPAGFAHIRCLAHGNVGVVVLNRPAALNALSDALVAELGAALDLLESDEAIGCIVLAGGAQCFAAGADIHELRTRTYLGAYREDLITRSWERVAASRKPVIAAVAGIAFGGGCELAMMCDFILAADNARFSLPEILVGTVGGTQRLTRFVGKSKAMEMVLTGREMNAEEAERAGAVSRVLPLGELLDEAIATAGRIASLSQPAVMMAKECVNRCYETSLAEGIRFERRIFHASFALPDQHEAMNAFAQKRPPSYAHWRQAMVSATGDRR